METRTQDVEKAIAHSLKEAQNICVGIFKPNKSTVWEPVIENSDGILVCVRVGSMLGLSIKEYSIEAGQFVKFPDGKNLTEFLNNPVAFHTWIQSLTL